MSATDEMIQRPSTLSRMLRGISLLKESPIAMFGAALVLFWILMALIAPILPLYGPLDPIMPFQKIGASAPDGNTFWLGTDHKGRDILSRVIWGSQRVLIWATLSTVVAYLVGMVMGSMAGYLGGWWDEAISFVANVLLSFPVMILYILIISYLGALGDQYRDCGDICLRARNHAHCAGVGVRFEKSRLYRCGSDSR